MPGRWRLSRRWRVKFQHQCVQLHRRAGNRSAHLQLLCDGCHMLLAMDWAPRDYTRQNLATTFHKGSRKGQEGRMCQTLVAFQRRRPPMKASGSLQQGTLLGPVKRGYRGSASAITHSCPRTRSGVQRLRARMVLPMTMTDRTFLITGATGFLGGAVTVAALRAGYGRQLRLLARGSLEGSPQLRGRSLCSESPARRSKRSGCVLWVVLD